MDEHNHHGRGQFFLALVLALVPALAISIWGIRYFAAQSGGLALAILLILVVFAVVAILAIAFARRIFLHFGLPFAERLSSTVTPLVTAISSSLSGDQSAVKGAVEEAGKKFASWYSGVTLRGWIMRSTVALLAVFGSLVGIALLEQQNTLLETQNSLMVVQNEFFRRQIRQQDVEDYHARRSELIKTIFDERECRGGETPLADHTGCPVSSVQARVAAAISLYGIEDAVRNSPERGAYISAPKVTDLSGVDFRGAVIFGANLRGAVLTGANFEGAFLDSVDLSGANLYMATFGGPELAELKSANFVNVNLSGASLVLADLQWVALNADVTGADLSQADLKGADLRAAKNLEKANLEHVRCCPVESPRGTVWPWSDPSGGYTYSGCIVPRICDTAPAFSEVTWDGTTGERVTRIFFDRKAAAVRAAEDASTTANGP